MWLHGDTWLHGERWLHGATWLRGGRWPAVKVLLPADLRCREAAQRAMQCNALAAAAVAAAGADSPTSPLLQTSSSTTSRSFPQLPQTVQQFPATNQLLRLPAASPDFPSFLTRQVLHQALVQHARGLLLLAVGEEAAWEGGVREASWGRGVHGAR